MKTVFKPSHSFIILLCAGLTSLFTACRENDVLEPQKPTENPVPVVNAGTDKTVSVKTGSVTLSGTATVDKGSIKSVTWTQVSGPNTAVLTNDPVNANAVSASNLRVGTYVFRFTAVSDKNVSQLDEAAVTVEADNTLPAGSRLKKIAYSATDFQEFEYDSEGKLTRYVSQYQFVQGDPTKIQRITYQMQYDDLKRLVRVTQNNGTLTTSIKTYFYKDGVLEKTEEARPNGRLLERRTFTFADNRLMQELRETADDAGQVQATYRTDFAYAGNGNLTKETVYLRGNSGFNVDHTFEYSDFDDKPKSDHLLTRFLFLPSMVLHPNNPGKVVMKLANGTVNYTENYTFQYSPTGLPVRSIRQKTQGNVNSQLEATFVYE
ncbi:MAG: hypothetical protein MUD08_05505 [Cytophagales bacterium]|jgi:hypothetical protein|nr:hypothetical protein [Cytophagales bacterium]